MRETTNLSNGFEKTRHANLSDDFEQNTQATGYTLSLKISFLRELATALAEQVQALNAPQIINVALGINLHDEVERFETELIKNALSCTGGHQRAAARLLGLKPTTLNAKIKHYKIACKLFVVESSNEDQTNALREAKELSAIS